MFFSKWLVFSPRSGPAHVPIARTRTPASWHMVPHCLILLSASNYSWMCLVSLPGCAFKMHHFAYGWCLHTFLFWDKGQVMFSSLKPPWARKGIRVCWVKNALRTAEDWNSWRKIEGGGRGGGWRKYTWVGEKCKNAGEKKYVKHQGPVTVMGLPWTCTEVCW